MNAPALSEAAWQSRVVDLARYLGLRVFHSGDSRRDLCAGYPDLHILGPRGSWFLELKAENGRVKAEQAAWITDLRRAGHDADIVRPSQWDDVSQRLRAMAWRP